MEEYKKEKEYILYKGDMLDMLEVIESNSVDSIVTDPPYELNFMGKGWDNAGVSFRKETWEKCYEVLKPGGYLLAFGGSRTFHRIAVAIEDAGFEIRDTIMWLYGSGFPKSMNIGLAIDKKNGVEVKTDYIPNNKNNVYGKAMGGGNVSAGHKNQKAQNEWDGWGTQLKPSFEPIIVARKPFKGSCIDNIMKYGVGGINIDECRVGTEIIKGGTMPDFRDIGQKSKEAIGIDKLSFGQVKNAKRKPLEEHTGRFPANTILTYDETDFDEVCGGFPNTPSTKHLRRNNSFSGGIPGIDENFKKETYFCKDGGYNDSGSVARYFYCAKASKKDRDEGLEEFEQKQVRVLNATNPELENKDDVSKRFITIKKNIHPCVKPTNLMQYLVRLVTPNDGTILDPFMGSGSTGKAIMYENKERNKNYKFIGIELEPEYLDISEARLDFVIKKGVE